MFSVPKGYFRFAGWSMLVGGLMGFSGQLIHIGDTPSSLENIPGFLQTAVNSHIWLAWASIFLLMGLPAIYFRQAEKLKLWGWIGLPLLFIGMILEIFHGPFQILGYPIIYSLVNSDAVLTTVNDQVMNMTHVEQYPMMLTLFVPIVPGIFIGLLLLSIATIRARVLHKGYGIFTLVILVVIIGGMSAPHVPFFSLVHLVFFVFGVKLAFEKNVIVPTAQQFTV